MSAAAVFINAYAALGMIALSMARHCELLGRSGKVPAPQVLMALRLAGWGLLALSLGPALAAWGVSVGIAGWLGVLSFAALALALQLTYAPRSAAWSALAAALVSLCAALAVEVLR